MRSSLRTLNKTKQEIHGAGGKGIVHARWGTAFALAVVREIELEQREQQCGGSAHGTPRGLPDLAHNAGMAKEVPAHRRCRLNARIGAARATEERRAFVLARCRRWRNRRWT